MLRTRTNLLARSKLTLRMLSSVALNKVTKIFMNSGSPFEGNSYSSLLLLESQIIGFSRWRKDDRSATLEEEYSVDLVFLSSSHALLTKYSGFPKLKSYFVIGDKKEGKCNSFYALYCSTKIYVDFSSLKDQFRISTWFQHLEFLSF